MTRYEHSVVIRRPVEDVWAYVIDPANDPVWQGPVIDVRADAGPDLKVGSRIEEDVQYLGRRFRIVWEVTEHQPPHYSAVRLAEGPVPMWGTYRFEPVEGGTRFTMEGEADAHGLFKLAEPLFARMARREWASYCDVLKDLLEADVSTASP